MVYIYEHDAQKSQWCNKGVFAIAGYQHGALHKIWSNLGIIVPCNNCGSGNHVHWIADENALLQSLNPSFNTNNHRIIIDLWPTSTQPIELTELSQIEVITYMKNGAVEWNVLKFYLKSPFSKFNALGSTLQTPRNVRNLEVDKKEWDVERLNEIKCVSLFGGDKEEIHEFLYLSGQWSNNHNLWNWGGFGPMNAALLYPDARNCFGTI